MVRKFILNNISEIQKIWNCKPDDAVLQYNNNEYEIDKFVPVLLINPESVIDGQ